MQYYGFFRGKGQKREKNLTIGEAIIEAAERLGRAGIAEARRDAALLVQAATWRGRAFVIANPEHELSDGEAERFRSYVARREAREPLQYIRGTQEFWGLEFEVSAGVLIPRPETEIIVEKAVEMLRGRENATICEIGVGSGCISVSILKELASARVVGLDVSEKALETSRRNALKHGVSERLKLRISDVFESAGGERFDAVVSNPPYIPASDIAGLEPEVREFEPAGALTDGGDGLSVIRRVAAGSAAALRPAGFLLMEIGYGQAESVAGLFGGGAWRSFELLADLQGIPRTVLARRE
jgi:release factor glutamine methyltransferase